MEYKNITITDINDLAKMYVETFNSPPWNDKWTLETACKRLKQMINTEDFYGLYAYQEGNLCGMVLGSHEQFFNGVMFNIKGFCVRNNLRSNGVGTKLLNEFDSQPQGTIARIPGSCT